MQLNSAEFAGTDIQEQGRVVLGTGKEKKHIFYTAATAVQAFCNSSAKQLAFSDDCCGLRMIPEVIKWWQSGVRWLLAGGCNSRELRHYQGVLG